MTIPRALHNRIAAWAIVVGAGLVYALAALAGGTPAFPSPDDCVHPATRDGKIMLVYGYFDSTVPADALQERMRRLGYTHAEVVSDGGCGRLRVVVRGYPTLAGAHDAAAEARRVGLRPGLEVDGSP